MKPKGSKDFRKPEPWKLAASIGSSQDPARIFQITQK
jgi:hypothetical protein